MSSNNDQTAGDGETPAETAVELDSLDFAILHLIESSDRALWKNKIHQHLEDQMDSLPITDTPSVQTVGRRVEQLNNEEMLENVITSPDELKRDLIIAFTVTEPGRDAMHAKRDQILRGIVQDNLFAGEKETIIGKDALVTLLQDEMREQADMDPAGIDGFSEAELVSLLGMYYAEKEAASVFAYTDRADIRDMIRQKRKHSRSLIKNTERESPIDGHPTANETQ